MIPIQLTIEGLYSYQQRQTIDFTQLTDAGLFGIFGAVGSGKSSILEAITFALYGETERLNSKDRRSYNMMNLKSDRSYIEFDFYNYENKLFRSTREFKRNSKKFEDIKTGNSILYEFKNEKWIPLESNNIEPIIGLSYTNFKRTIIIPQGQFKEFLELGETDRTRMMKEIFNLHRYDLQDKVAVLSKKNLMQLNQFEGQLKGFENISEEEIQHQNLQLNEAKNIYAEHEKLAKESAERFQHLKNIKAEIEQLNEKKTSFESLENQQEYFVELTRKVDEFEHLTQVFKQDLEILKQLKSEHEKKANEYQNQTEKLNQIQNEFTQVEKDLTEIQDDYKQLEFKKTELSDLELIAKIAQDQQEIILLQENTKKGIDFVNVEVEKQQINLTTSEKLEKEIEDSSAKLISGELIMNIDRWFLEQKTIVENQSKCKKNIVEKQKNILDLTTELSNLNINQKTFENDYKTEIERLEQKEKEIQLQRNHFIVQQKLVDFTANLNHGEECPLCGSLEHPKIVEIEDVSTNLTKLQEEENQIKTAKTTLLNLKSTVDGILSRKAIFDEQLKKEHDQLTEFQKIIKIHQEKFVWKELNVETEKSFSVLKNQTFTQKEAIKTKQESLKLLRNEAKGIQDTLVKAQNRLDELRKEENSKNTEITLNLNNLKVLKFADFESMNKNDLRTKIHDTQQFILKTEQQFENLNKKYAELSPQLASQKTLVETTKTRLHELTTQVENTQNQIDTNLKLNKFSNIEEINQQLALQLNIAEAREQIQNYHIEYGSLKQLIIELEKKLKDVEFDEEKFETAEIQLKEAQEQLKISTEKVATIKAEIQRLTTEFEKKRELLKQFEQLQKRAENLKTMSNLFKAAGFVQYVSTIYLQQLCENANVRFHRMTRNQLSLQLNEKGDFEIIDYLNEGRSRSVKTLSGGQTFQASLSLALALAESVQTNAKSDKNFFFIDEGFGTQDGDAVNIVFETLLSLQKENRIVGIISHVDELKERIPMALSITKDEEKGSFIEVI